MHTPMRFFQPPLLSLCSFLLPPSRVGADVVNGVAQFVSFSKTFNGSIVRKNPNQKGQIKQTNLRRAPNHNIQSNSCIHAYTILYHHNTIDNIHAYIIHTPPIYTLDSNCFNSNYPRTLLSLLECVASSEIPPSFGCWVHWHCCVYMYR